MTRKLLIFFAAVLSMNLHAEVAVELMFKRETITQGSIVKATYRMDTVGESGFDPRSLVGQTFSDTIHIHSLTPSAQEVELVFAKVPEQNHLLAKLGTQSIRFSWAAVSVTPTELSRGLIFGEFSIPERFPYLFWILSVGGTMLLLIVGIMVFRSYRQKQKARQFARSLKGEILGCASYEDVVELWTRKHQFLLTFPQLSGPMANLETVLFKYQFKPSQDQAERKEVMRAYERFCSEAQGGLNGI